MPRRQRHVVNPHVVYLAAEPVGWPSPAADAQRLARLEILIHVIEVNFQLLRFPIHVDLEAIRGS